MDPLDEVPSGADAGVVEMSLDGTILGPGDALSDSGTLLLRPTLAGGTEHLHASPGRWRFTGISWDDGGIRLGAERA